MCLVPLLLLLGAALLWGLKARRSLSDPVLDTEVIVVPLAVIVVVVADVAAAAGDTWLPTLNATLFLLVAGLMGEGDCIERVSFPSPASPDVLALAGAAVALDAAAAAFVSLISRSAILAS